MKKKLFDIIACIRDIVADSKIRTATETSSRPTVPSHIFQKMLDDISSNAVKDIARGLPTKRKYGPQRQKGEPTSKDVQKADVKKIISPEEAEIVDQNAGLFGENIETVIYTDYLSPISKKIKGTIGELTDALEKIEEESGVKVKELVDEMKSKIVAILSDSKSITNKNIHSLSGDVKSIESLKKDVSELKRVVSDKHLSGLVNEKVDFLDKQMITAENFKRLSEENWSDKIVEIFHKNVFKSTKPLLMSQNPADIFSEVVSIFFEKAKNPKDETIHNTIFKNANPILLYSDYEDLENKFIKGVNDLYLAIRNTIYGRERRDSDPNQLSKYQEEAEGVVGNMSSEKYEDMYNSVISFVDKYLKSEVAEDIVKKSIPEFRTFFSRYDEEEGVNSSVSLVVKELRQFVSIISNKIHELLTNEDTREEHINKYIKEYEKSFFETTGKKLETEMQGGSIGKDFNFVALVDAVISDDRYAAVLSSDLDKIAENIGEIVLEKVVENEKRKNEKTETNVKLKDFVEKAESNTLKVIPPFIRAAFGRNRDTYIKGISNFILGGIGPGLTNNKILDLGKSDPSTVYHVFKLSPSMLKDIAEYLNDAFEENNVLYPKFVTISIKDNEEETNLGIDVDMSKYGLTNKTLFYALSDPTMRGRINRYLLKINHPKGSMHEDEALHVQDVKFVNKRVDGEDEKILNAFITWKDASGKSASEIKEDNYETMYLIGSLLTMSNASFKDIVSSTQEDGVKEEFVAPQKAIEEIDENRGRFASIVDRIVEMK